MTLTRLRALKFLRALQTARGRRALMRGIAASEEHEALLALVGSLNHVLDVGANRGQFALLVRRLHPEARIEAWEPLPRARSRLEWLFKDDPSVTVHPWALGSTNQSADLHETRDDDNSSLLQPLETTRGATSLGEAVRVQVRRLDDHDLGHLGRGRSLLKLDVQGYEDRVLAGAARTLESIDAVLVELTFGAYYESQARPSSVLSQLFDAGFDVAGIGRLAVVGSATSQADVLLTRVDA